MSRDEVGRLLDGVGTAHGKEVEHFKVAVQHVRRRSQRRFHDAARRAEDGAAARRGREGVVELFVGQLRKLDARGLDHARKFARRDRRIDFALHFGAVALVLLRRAGDDGDGIEILGTDVVFFAPVRLEERAEHLLGRLAGREVGDHLGILLLHELDPRGAAGGEHGHRLARLDAVDELARLFHDGQVRGHVHVEHFAGTQTADRGDHLALNVGADGHIERLAQCRADGGRREEHDLLCGIRERLPDLVDRGALGERADGAGDDALPAAHAHRFKEGHIERAADMHVEAAPDGADRVDVLLSARRDAAHAVDALVVVSHHVGRGGIDGQDEVLALESVLVYAVAEGELLKLAVVVSLAGEALFLVLGEEQLQRHLSAFAALLGIRSDLHALGDGVHARGDETSRARCFHDAHTAGADAGDVFEVAQGRDLDMCLSCRLQDSRPLGDGDGNSVNGQCNIFRHDLHLSFSQLHRTCSSAGTRRT